MREEKKIEYALGKIDDNTFEILEHTLNPAPHEFDSGCLFYLNDISMGDGDGHPAYYNPKVYKTIPEEGYKETMKKFQETGNKMDSLCNNAKELDRDIQPGDYLFLDGIFFSVFHFSYGRYLVKSFFHDDYAICFDEDTEVFLGQNDFFKEYEIKAPNEYKVITKEIYDEAIEIAKSGIKEVKNYFKKVLSDIK